MSDVAVHPTKQVEVPLLALMKGRGLGEGLSSTLRSFLTPPAAVRVWSRSPKGPAIPIVIVEPHPDDAVLSLGGFIMSHPGPIHIMTVFSDSHSVHPELRRLVEQLGISIRELRTYESQAAAEALGVTWERLGFREAGLGTNDDAALNERVPDLRAVLKERINENALVLLPAAFGSHPDHLALAQCESAFALCALYEDVAPSQAYSRSTEEFWLRYNALCPEHLPIYWAIDEVMDAKIEVAQLYRSQFTPRQAHGLERHARAVGVSARHLTHEVPRGNAFERLYVASQRFESMRARLINSESSSAIRSIAPAGPLESVSLTSEEIEEPALANLFKRRRTRRSLTASEVSLQQLSRVLDLCARGTHSDDELFLHYPYPTTGGLGSSSISVLPWNVRGLERVVYQYQGQTHELKPTELSVPPRSLLFEYFGRQDCILGASVGFLLEVSIYAAEQRYGAGAWQLLLLESGHLAQALQMLLCHMGMQCVFLPAFDKPQVERLCPGRRALGLVLASGNVKLAAKAGELQHRRLKLTRDPLSGIAEAGGEIPREVSLELHAKEVKLSGGSGFFLARCRVPTTTFASTGWALALADEIELENRERFESRASICAAAEARELFVARTSAGDAIVTGNATHLDAPPIRAGMIVTDSRQGDAMRAGRTRLMAPDRARFWIRGTELLSGAKVWLPTDAILMDRRFFCGELLPTSCGLGCRPTIEDALTHAALEVIEKAVLRNLLVSWSSVVPSGPRAEALANALISRDESPAVYTTRIMGVHACRVLCHPSGAQGSAVRGDLGTASESALGECLAQVIGGVGMPGVEAVESTFGADSLLSVVDAPDIRSFLERSNLRLGWVELHSQESRFMPLSNWPVVKVVAWRADEFK